MRIKRLEVQGFKSFCDRQVITFNDPITAVVGPNGCGKSNIVDAIRWCMGEQSAKHLRGKAMDDVIFSGSDSRGPLGMCEVTLVFENDGNVPLEYLAYSEIAITRKLYRDGTSEYFLNKTACRLRDVVDFFLGTGVGAKAYSIIEQGRVGMIVSSRPEDRRFLIEEAAGITKYKVKKKAAEKKMEGTRQNLLRVSDVVAELDKQLGSLRRQAQKAERYKLYKSELKELELWSSTQRWLGLHSEARLAESRLQEITAQKGERQEALLVKETTLEADRMVLVEVEERLTTEQQVLFELGNRIRLGEAENDHAEREMATIAERRSEIAREQALLDEQMEEMAAAHERAEAERLEFGSSDRSEEVARLESNLFGCKEGLAKKQVEVENARAEIAHCKTEMARAESVSHAATRQREDSELRRARLAEESERLSQRALQLRTDVARLSEALGDTRQLTLALVGAQKESETRIEELKVALKAGGNELDALTRDLHQRSSRRRSLEELHTRYEGFAHGTRAVMRERADRWGIRGLVAEFVEAPPELEVAVEAALGERLGAILVDSQEVGVEAIQQLKAKSEGRSSFVPMNRLAEQPILPEQSIEGAERFIDAIRFQAGYESLAAMFSEVWLVDDLIDALDRWRALPQDAKQTFVTRDGEVVDRVGTVSGGSRETAGTGVLQQKRELRDLTEMIATLEAQHQSALLVHNQRRAELSERTVGLESMKQNSHQHEIQILGVDKDLGRLRDEEERIKLRLQQVGVEQTELGARVEESTREVESAELAVVQLREQAISLEDQLSQCGLEVVSALHAVEVAQEALTHLRVEVAELTERRAGVERTIAHLTEERAERAERRERLGRSIEEGQTRMAELQVALSSRRQEVLQLVAEHGSRQSAMNEDRGAYETQRQRLMTAEGVLRELRSVIDALSQEVNQWTLKLHEVASARAHLEETIAERYRLDLKSEVQAYHLRPQCSAKEDKRLRELRDLIDRMGDINLYAIEEYNQLETRYNFLSSQKEDLEKALTQLEEAIDRINRTCRKRFRDVFDLVNTKFQELFPRCFRGGQARLVLTDEDNLLESGIEIIAQPPGKKNATVEMLSGGEKAMTAVALIFAIFLIKPSPFCLLDEVDAPLDDANVARFNDLIMEMTDRSQFILITHNKRTMQIASTLYGVTMEEPGISKMVSVNLGIVDKLSPERARRSAVVSVGAAG